MQRNTVLIQRLPFRRPALLIPILLACGANLALAAPAGSTCYVPSGGTYSFTSIQAAVNDAGCATIRVSAGTYSTRIKIARSVALIGSGAAVTTIDGQGLGPVIDASGDVTIDGFTIANGTGDNMAGGIYMPSGNLKLLNSVVRYNKAVRGHGGGVEFRGATATIQDSMIANNSAADQGGGIYFRGTSVRLIRTTLANNTARAGGGMYASTDSVAKTVALENTTVTNNSQAGIQVHLAKIYVSNSTIAHNIGRGLYLESRYNEVSLKSSIFTYNGGNCYYNYYNPNNAGITDLGNNLRWPAADLTCAGTYADPRLGSLANWGGVPDVMLPAWNSPAVDRGSCTNHLNTGVPVDARLLLRTGFGCDIGAAEYAATTSSSPNAAWWKLDEEPGEYTVRDASGRGLTGTVNGSITPWSPSRANTIFYNRGSLYAGTGSWVSAPVATTATDGVSLTAWVNCAGCSSFTNNMVPAYVGSTGGNGFGLFITRSDMRVRLLLGGRTIFDFGYSLPLTNVWTHLALVRAQGVWRLYANGTQVGGTTSAAPGAATGTTVIGASSYGAEKFGGLIDDVRVYNRPLYATEVSWLATGDK